MKLFTKYNRVNILVTILTFLVGSVAFYFVLQYVLVRQLDQSLYVEQQEIVDYARLHNSLPDITDTKHQWIVYKETTATIIDPKPYSVPFYNKQEDEHESIRILHFTVSANGKLYAVTVNQSEAETEDLLKLIILITVCMIAVILLSNYIINRKLIVKTLRPFYHTIDHIKDLDIQQPLRLPEEKVEEINLLNESLNKMTERINLDYRALKTFTENASHEMQTPLAVIRLQIEALLQDAEGNESMVRKLLAMEEATLRLSRLHKSLLLLTKLENKQYMANEPVDMQDVVKEKLQEKRDMILAKPVFLSVNTCSVIIPFHKHLAEILISNLLSNAIKYCPEGGLVEIKLFPDYISVKNNSTGASLDKHKVFTRFYKADQGHDGTGLGLAIIKEICTLAGFTATYRFEKDMHDFTIHFMN